MTAEQYKAQHQEQQRLFHLNQLQEIEQYFKLREQMNQITNKTWEEVRYNFVDDNKILWNALKESKGYDVCNEPNSKHINYIRKTYMKDILPPDVLESITIEPANAKQNLFQKLKNLKLWNTATKI